MAILRRLAPLGVAVALVGGCGGDDDPARPVQIAPAEATTVRCISDAGARIARSPADLGFFLTAQARGHADHPGTVFTNHWTVAVQLWENAPGQEPAWRLWAAEPVKEGRSSSVLDLVTDPSEGSYVAFVLRPRGQAVRAVERCLEAVYGRRGNPVTRR